MTSHATSLLLDRVALTKDVLFRSKVVHAVIINVCLS